MKVRFFRTMLIAVSFITLWSCSIDDDSNNYYQNPNVAIGIIANASPDSGDLFFYADNNNINSNPLNYTDAAGYYNFYLGERTFSIQDAEGNELATLEKTLTAQDFFSLFAVNTFTEIELVIYDDIFDFPPQNTASVRFINLSTDAPAINISSETEDFATALEFKQATDFIEVPAGTYDITYTDDTNDTALYTDTDMVFYSGRVYTVYTKGYVTPPVGSNDTFSTERMANY